jgi:hypothetical protein
VTAAVFCLAATDISRYVLVEDLFARTGVSHLSPAIGWRSVERFQN